MNAHALILGKAYACIIDGDHGPDKTTIIPLSINQNKSQRLIVIDAKKLHSIDPKFLIRLTKMSFDEIRREDINGGPDRSRNGHVWIFEIDEHGNLYDERNDAFLRDFIETDLPELAAR